MEPLSLQTKYRMNCGHEIPALGFGVCFASRALFRLSAQRSC